MPAYGRVPKVVYRTLVANTGFADTNNIIDIPTLYGAGKDAKFVQIQVIANATVKVKLNNDSGAVLIIDGPATQIFNPGDIRVTRLAFDNQTSSGGASTDIQVVLGL